ncbi:hypothetical protein FEA23_07215 [Mannheimia haemolytica]|nr:hypothetical protein FEA23_07215 [Mannheimia haemolytica]
MPDAVGECQAVENVQFFAYKFPYKLHQQIVANQVCKFFAGFATGKCQFFDADRKNKLFICLSIQFFDRIC